MGFPDQVVTPTITPVDSSAGGTGEGSWAGGDNATSNSEENNWRDPNSPDRATRKQYAEARGISEDEVIMIESGRGWRQALGLSDETPLTSVFPTKRSVIFDGKNQLTWDQAEGYDEMVGKGLAYRGPGGGPPMQRAAVSQPPPPVLIPGRDALNFGTNGAIDSLTSFIFEDLGGTEIITLLKRDTIDGIDPNYSIISNISEIRRDIDPTKLISKKIKHNSYFDIFAIKLLDKIPDTEYLTKNNLQNFYYINTNGDLVIEFDNLADGEIIDVQIATSGTINKLDND